MLEVEAYQRQLLVNFSAWQVETIILLDDAVRGVWATTDKTPATDNATVAIDDRKGVRGLLSSIRDRMAVRNPT